MGVVTFDLGRAALDSSAQWAIFAASGVLALRFKWGSTALLALGALGSVLLHLL
jgi:hypothetical protein